jgi:glycogen debranching enzyme
MMEEEQVMSIQEKKGLEKPSVDYFKESKTDHLQDLYITAGDRSSVIGSQNGLFPDFGHHVKEEMGGVWTHPIKLLDGYWLHIKEADEEQGFWLKEADRFHNYPFYNEHVYTLNHRYLEIVRRQFCPDGVEGVVVSYYITNCSDNDRKFDFSFLGRTELSPVWFSETLGIEDAPDDGRLDEEEGIFIGHDQKNAWYVVFGSDRPFQKGIVDRNLFGPEKTVGQGISGLLTYKNISIKKGETAELNFFIVGSNESLKSAVESFGKLKENREALFESKKQRYNDMLRTTNIKIPDKHLEKVFNWNKFHMDWLTMEVPAIGRGLAAGHPEYSWWFGCDNSYALQGNLPIGNLDLAKDTINLIHQVSEATNGNGRIIHEVTTYGAVSNKGNTQETPHFIKCVWDIFLWTGDLQFLENIYPTVKKGIRWLLEEMDPDRDLLPEGYGIIEIEGLNVELIDSAVYTYEALHVGSLMAVLFQENKIAEEYETLAEKLKKVINAQLWIEDEQLYADAMATPEMVLGRIDLYIERARRDGAEKAAVDMEMMKEKMSKLDQNIQQPWLFKNWVINTPMETGIAPKEKAIPALNRMGTDEFTGEWGTYLSGMYQTAMMTISTAVQAVAECRYDRSEEALRYVNLISSTFNKRLPGSIYEMSPDYGCFVQAWTAYGLVTPLISYFFGIQPRAYWKEVTIRPRLPQSWNHAEVERVKIGTGEGLNELNVSLLLSEKEDVYELSLKEIGWKVTVDLSLEPLAKVFVDDKEMDYLSGPITISNATSHTIRVRKQNS